MSISGFSVQHDWEVQEYNLRRAAWKASEKARKQEEKSLRAQAKLARGAALQQMEVLGIGKKKLWSVKLIGGSRKQDRSNGLVSTIEDKFGGGYESDEITLTEALAARR